MNIQLKSIFLLFVGGMILISCNNRNKHEGEATTINSTEKNEKIAEKTVQNASNDEMKEFAKELKVQIKERPKITVPLLTELISYNPTQFKNYALESGFTYNKEKESYERETDIDYIKIQQIDGMISVFTIWQEDYSEIKNSLPKYGFKYNGKKDGIETYVKNNYQVSLLAKENEQYFIFVESLK